MLAILADPVVVAPGERLSLRALVAGTEDPGTTRWLLCVMPRTVPPRAWAQGCLDTPELQALPPVTGERATFEIPPAEGWALLRWVFIAYGNGVNLAEVERNGLDLIAVAERTTAEGTLRASKRLLLSLSELRAPAVAVPTFRFGAFQLAPSAEDPDRCTPLDGAPLQLRPGATVRVEPELQEPLQLSHYADGGSFPLGGTRPDLLPWTAPSTAGRVTHWLVAQQRVMRPEGPDLDAVAACRFEVEVR
jgi:hypothetical protein